MGLANDHALAGRKAVRLDDHGQPLATDVGRIEGRGGEGGVGRGGYAVTLQEILAEGLRSFEARRGPGGPEAGAARRREAIDHTGDQRSFGTHDGEADVLAHRQLQQGVDIVGGNADVAHLGFERRTGVSRSHEHESGAGRLRAPPRERVLAAAAADDQYLHQWRKWRIPVNTMAMPCSSAAAMTSASRFEPPG